jgi:hypothetical protein
MISNVKRCNIAGSISLVRHKSADEHFSPENNTVNTTRYYIIEAGLQGGLSLPVVSPAYRLWAMFKQ